MDQDIELLTLISDLISSKDTSRKAIGSEVKRLTAALREQLAKAEAERDALKNIIKDARAGNYDNAHEIHAVRKYLYEAMEKYEKAALKGDS